MSNRVMGKKRRSVASSLEEVDRTMYTTFRSTANCLSQLYSQATNQQRLAFQAGQRHSLEKIYEWILLREEEGSRVTTSDIIAHLQNELEYSVDELPASPRFPFQHHHTQSTTTIPNTGAQVLSGPCPARQSPCSGPFEDHAKSLVYSSALSSPVRPSLPHYQLDQGGCHLNNVTMLGRGARNDETNSAWDQSRDLSSFSSSFSSMDMHTDSPSRSEPAHGQ